MLHYSTTPSLQQIAARGKDYWSPLRGQHKARSFGPGSFTLNFRRDPNIIMEESIEHGAEGMEKRGNDAATRRNGETEIGGQRSEVRDLKT